MTTCPNCGNLIAMDTTLCDSCGSNVGPEIILQSIDTLNTPADAQPNAWKLRYFGLFLLIDAIFISILEIINPLPLSANYSYPLKVVTVIVVFTGQYLVAFVIGMLLALVCALLMKQIGKEYRYITWTRALAFSLLPTAFIIYVNWLSR